MSILNTIRSKAAANHHSVIFPEAEIDARVLQAADILIRDELLSPILLGNPDKIQSLASDSEVSLNSSIKIVDPDEKTLHSDMCQIIGLKLKRKNLSDQEIEKLASDPLMVAGVLLDEGVGHCAVAGSVASTPKVIKSAIYTVGVDETTKLVSSIFLMDMPDSRVFTFADCGVVPYPDEGQLASIAIASSKTHKLLTGNSSITAFLSFSTLGSAEHERVDLVRKALNIAIKRAPELLMDGELQFDAALMPDIASRKAPDSDVAGRANVFIFPNLDAANIGYKITERLAGAVATGPVLQGLRKPYMDLSRGCSPQDIVNVASVGSLLV